MAHEINKARVRDRLTARPEPYWGAPIGRGQALGFRKIDAATGSWVARQRDERGRKIYRALGFVATDFDYEAARAAAIKWFKARDAGIEDDKDTVADACRAYVTDRRNKKSEACAHDAEKRFERTVYGTDFGTRLLAKLKTPHIEDWRDGLDLGKSSSNRTLTALKAALNHAVSRKRVHREVAGEWADVKPYADAGKRRTLFLDLAQRKALLEAATGAVRDLIAAAALTGARAGELTGATRGQFDARLGTLTLKGKVGTRTIPLSAAALALFTRLAKDKTPLAYLLTRDDGKPWAHSDWDGLVRDAAAAAVVKDGKGNALKDGKGKEVRLPAGVCLYTLRHSYISQSISDGLTTLDTARLCGTSVTMIEKNYGHLVADAVRERMAKVQML